MDTKWAIKEAYRKQKERYGENFQSEVEDLVLLIEEASNRLRQLKSRLADLKYEDPKSTADLLD